MNSQQLRLIGIIAILVVGYLFLEPANELIEAHKEVVNKKYPSRNDYMKGYVGDVRYKSAKKYYPRQIIKLKEKRNSKIINCLPYLIGFLILIFLIANPQTIGAKIGVLKQKQN